MPILLNVKAENVVNDLKIFPVCQEIDMILFIDCLVCTSQVQVCFLEADILLFDIPCLLSSGLNSY